MSRIAASGGAILVGLMLASGASAQSGAADVCANMPSPAEEIACLRGALEESRAGRAATREAAPDPAQPAAIAARPQRGAEPAQEFGREQVAATRSAERAAKAEPAALRAVATLVRFDHLGLVTIRLDNGQVWKQAEGRAVPLRLRENQTYPVEIQPSGFGGYRMNFTQLGRQIVVRRME